MLRQSQRATLIDQLCPEDYDKLIEMIIASIADMVIVDDGRDADEQ